MRRETGDGGKKRARQMKGKRFLAEPDGYLGCQGENSGDGESLTVGVGREGFLLETNGERKRDLECQTQEKGFETPLSPPSGHQSDAEPRTENHGAGEAGGGQVQRPRRGRQRRPSPEPQLARDGGSGLGEALELPR